MGADPPVDPLARSVAIYGAIVSTAAVAWNMLRDVRDRGRLRIDAMVGRIVITTPRSVLRTDPADRVFFTITNIGRRAITPTQIAGRKGPLRRSGWWWHRQLFVLIPANLPRSLNPGDSVNERMDQVSDIEPVHSLFVTDSVGKRWYLSRRALRRAREKARERQTSPAAEATSSS